MATNSAIEWTETTWNPVTGCTKISSGCQNCYAERMAKRLKAMGQPNYVNGFKVSLHPRMIEQPLHWKRSRVVFVNSMSDLFHKDIPESFIQNVFDVMHRAHWHRFQVLTKRDDRLVKLAPQLQWSSNIWMGVTVESAKYIDRIDNLRLVGAAVRFLSLEPLLSAMPNMDLTGIDWVIAGGESGPGSRPMLREWVRDIRDQCKKSSTAFFFKQWGGTNKKQAGRTLDGKIYSEMPNSEQFAKLGN
ncbi:MAG: phage Gp37/Gp68 family protein [Pirellulales bacterium]|nr:phage Gp37/Gp68 family protein [Pirellulales bacterium]